MIEHQPMARAHRALDHPYKKLTCFSFLLKSSASSKCFNFIFRMLKKHYLLFIKSYNSWTTYVPYVPTTLTVVTGLLAPNVVSTKTWNIINYFLDNSYNWSYFNLCTCSKYINSQSSWNSSVLSSNLEKFCFKNWHRIGILQ